LSLQYATFNLSLSQSPTFVAKLLIDDPQLLSSLEDLFRSSNGNQNGGGNTLEMMNMLGNQGQPSTMFETQVTTSVGKVTQEIQAEQLFSVATQDQTLTMTLQRPASMDQLIASMLSDIAHQTEFANRLKNLRQLVNALKQYEAEFGCLPPAGTVLNHPDGLPNQFNWRVGLSRNIAPEVYGAFDFSKSWDDPANQEAAETIPELFLPSPSSEADQALVWKLNGVENGLYPAVNGVAPKLETIKDNNSYAAIVVESRHSEGYQWHSPESAVATDPVQMGRQDENGILFVSGSFNPKAVLKDSIKAVLSIAGNEDVSQNELIRLPRR
jgi:hypothetical protein